MRSRRPAGRPRRGLVIGCGGTLGFAWTAVALEAVERELAWDARTADVLVGTSAGAEMVALLGSGRSVGDVVAALHGDTADPVLGAHLSHHPGHTPPLPALAWPASGLVRSGLSGRVDRLAAVAGLLPRGRGDAGWLRRLGADLANADGWVDHPATWIVGASAHDGRRAAFGSPDGPRAALGDAIAASWAIPGWFPPAPVAGASYVDGGAVSPTSADLVLPLELDEVVIVAPMSTRGGVAGRGLSRVERVLRRAMTQRVDREQRVLEDAGTRVVRVEPGPEELAAMGFNFMDVRRRAATLEAARRHAPGRVRDAITQGAPA